VSLTADIARVGGARDGQAPAVVDWVFAYGSLLPAGHAVAAPRRSRGRTSMGGGARGRWRWTTASTLPNYKHYVAPDGHRPDLMVCYLDIDEARRRAWSTASPSRSAPTRLPAWTRAKRNYERPRTSPAAGQRDARWARVGLRRAAGGPCREPGSGRRERRPGHREAATRSACWPASTSCASGGASRCSPSRRACPSRAFRSCTTRRWPCRAAYVEPCMWLIDLFEVAPESDAAFLAAWESERNASAVLYRAPGERAWAFASSPSRPWTTARRPPVATRPSTRMGAPDGPEGAAADQPLRGPPRATTSASPPAGRRARARSPDAARVPRDAPSSQRGRERLPLRSTSPRWSSPLMFARATQRPAFREAADALRFPAYTRPSTAVVRGVERRSSPARRG